ncbi:MAG: sigma 54-interacting transcriptional regulator [Deltaproteobacteria bacterium]|nr:sigma 54-interacting transcriptional regulator [Deltaproteobacteria bacterium]
MPEKVLLSFIGSQDPLSRDNEDGPILTLAANQSFDCLILLHTDDSNTCIHADTTARLLKERFPGVSVKLSKLSIDDPTNYSQLLSAMRNIVREIPREVQVHREYFVSVASGTPAMHACWLLLTASGEIPANILYLRRPQHVKEGQPLLSEIDPRAREFPRILPHATMDDLPDITDVNLDKALENAGIVGDSQCMRDAIDEAVRCSNSDFPVLITGESGTGKELFAKLIYLVSKRRDKRFYPLNCGSLSSELVESELFGHKKGSFTGASADKKGAFDHADNGVLFLDEIGDLPLSAQVKLLRALQEKEITPIGGSPTKVNVRIIAATHRNLADKIKNGSFREDLFYRLNVLSVRLPPLRDRGTDILKIASLTLDRRNQLDKRRKQFTQRALEAITHYNWPGNARELVNLIEQAFVMAKTDIIDIDDLWKTPFPPQNQPLPSIPAFQGGFSLEIHLAEYRKNLYVAAMKQADNNQTKAAKLLGVTVQAVNKYMK